MGSDREAVTFPLPARFLPKVSLSAEDTTHYRTSAKELLARTLEQEIEFRLTAQGKLDPSQWKSFRSKDRLRVYKRRATGQQQASTPMVLAVGQIEGRVDDVLYGIHHKSTEEMRLSTSFLNARHLDAAVLHTIDTASSHDPFRRMDIKWRIAETPGGSIVSNRDVCALEYEGKRVDATGTSYGFHVVKSIDAPWFPELPDPRIIRARMMLCCIYRQRDATTVDCFMKGVFDLGGGILDLFAYETAANSLLSVTKTIQCATAKKLTLQLITEQQHQLQTFSRPAETQQEQQPLSSALHSRKGKDTACSVCHKKRPTLLHRIGTKWDRCCLCQGLSCSKCLVRETVFARPTNMTVQCCKLCVIASRARNVDPRDPFPVITSLVHRDPKA